MRLVTFLLYVMLVDPPPFIKFPENVLISNVFIVIGVLGLEGSQKFIWALTKSDFGR